MAEHTFALILSWSRKLRETYEKVRRDEFNLITLEGFDLRDKTNASSNPGRWHVS